VRAAIREVEVEVEVGMTRNTKAACAAGAAATAALAAARAGTAEAGWSAAAGAVAAAAAVLVAAGLVVLWRGAHVRRTEDRIGENGTAERVVTTVETGLGPAPALPPQPEPQQLARAGPAPPGQRAVQAPTAGKPPGPGSGTARGGGE
jgi:hypothetical protein